MELVTGVPQKHVFVPNAMPPIVDKGDNDIAADSLERQREILVCVEHGKLGKPGVPGVSA
jgi:hypothetical protein